MTKQILKQLKINKKVEEPDLNEEEFEEDDTCYDIDERMEWTDVDYRLERAY